ncbi:protein TONNEAU 1a-like [Hevea brasiliensis]|uniref:protein TONNEAU 1a-like n=1 Tax=Hevea brasiliensis TaxID=3981 RepID=UPI0025F1CEB8|nr:protein TONNEAU 1a-like [Hevea brasiliensis]
MYGVDTGRMLQEICQKGSNLFQGRGTGRRVSEVDSLSNLESRNVRRPSSSSVACGLPPLGRPTSSQASGKMNTIGDMTVISFPEDVIRASAAVEILQFDRKARNLTTKAVHGS